MSEAFEEFQKISFVTLRCNRCLKRRDVQPSHGWPVCCGEVMKEANADLRA